MCACGEISGRLKTSAMRVVFMRNFIIFKKVFGFFYLHFCYCTTKMGQDDYKEFALSVVRKEITCEFFNCLGFLFSLYWATCK